MAKYNEKELADTSKFLSFVLRHKPEAIGIVLDREGWANIDKLILCAQKRQAINPCIAGYRGRNQR